jgi:hypothetical protein
MPDRFPSSGEDWSIIRWWRRHPRQGLLCVEVVIGRGGPGDWPNRQSGRVIDGIHFPDHPDQTIHLWGRGTEGFASAVTGAEIEIVEAKTELTFGVIGQCIGGIDMFSRAYPGHGLLVPVAVVRGTPDPALKWACDRRGILVDAAPEAEVQQLRRSGRPPEL